MPDQRPIGIVVTVGVIGAIGLAVVAVGLRQHTTGEPAPAGLRPGAAPPGSDAGVGEPVGPEGTAREALPADVATDFARVGRFYVSRPPKSRPDAPARAAFAALRRGDSAHALAAAARAAAPAPDAAPPDTVPRDLARACNNLALAAAGQGQYLRAITVWNRAIGLDAGDAPVYRANRAAALAQAPAVGGGPLRILPASATPAGDTVTFLLLHGGGAPLYAVSAVLYIHYPAHGAARDSYPAPAAARWDMSPPNTYRILPPPAPAPGGTLVPGTLAQIVVTSSYEPSGLADSSFSAKYRLTRGRGGALRWTRVP